MTSTAAARRRQPKSRVRRLGIDAWVWIIVIAATPVQQLIFQLVTSQIRIMPLVASLLSLLLVRVARPRMQTTLVIAAFLIVLAGLVSGSNSRVIDSATVAVMFALLLAIAPSAILFQLRHYPTFLRTMLTVVLLVQTASAAAGIVQLAGVPILGVIARDGRVNGLAYHPNVLGIMSALAVLVLLDVLRRRGAPRLMVLIALAINVVALIATASLSSLITLVVGLLFYFGRLSEHARWIAILLAAALVVFALLATGGNLAALLPDAFSDRVNQVTGASADNDVASLLVRFQTYEHALRYLATDPFVGVGMDSLNQGTITPGLVVHNYILRGWYQGGFLLLSGFVILTVALLIVAARGMRRTPLTAPSAIIVAMLAFGATSAFYTQSNYWMPIMIAVAVISYIDPADDAPSQRARRTLHA